MHFFPILKNGKKEFFCEIPEIGIAGLVTELSRAVLWCLRSHGSLSLGARFSRQPRPRKMPPNFYRPPPYPQIFEKFFSLSNGLVYLKRLFSIGKIIKFTRLIMLFHLKQA